MPLKFTLGQATETGPRSRNEDFCGAVTPLAETLAAKGALFAVADGVSGGAGGREAAELTVRGLLSDYYATPDTWEVTAALDKVIDPASTNSEDLVLNSKNRRFAGGVTADHLDLAGRDPRGGKPITKLIIVSGNRENHSHLKLLSGPFELIEYGQQCVRFDWVNRFAIFVRNIFFHLGPYFI